MILALIILCGLRYVRANCTETRTAWYSKFLGFLLYSAGKWMLLEQVSIAEIRRFTTVLTIVKVQIHYMNCYFHTYMQAKSSQMQFIALPLLCLYVITFGFPSLTVRNCLLSNGDQYQRSRNPCTIFTNIKKKYIFIT